MLADPPVSFFFINDLTEKATGGPLVALIILFIVTQLGASVVMASRADKNQRIIMFVLPFVFAPFVITLPGRPRRLLDLDQRLDPRPADGRARLLPAAARSRRSRRSRPKTPPPPPPRKKKKRR